MYSSRVCVENRCVSTPARKDHVEPRALDGAFFFSLCVLRKNLNAAKPPEQSKGVLQPARFGYTGQTEIFLSPKPQTFPSGVNSNHQRATSTHVYDRFPLIRMRPMNKSDDLFAGGGGVQERHDQRSTPNSKQTS